MNSRNKNIDILRSLALLLILLYHAWVVCGSIPTRFTLVNTVVALGGEIGVTAFFALSGFGIYYSLQGMENQNQLHFIPFLKKRALRILPQYYMCLFFILFFMDGAYFLSRHHAGNILSHIFFVHNFFPSCFGAINGVLWTMGVTVQFYIIAILLYKGMKRFGFPFYLVGILFTIICKYIVYAYILPAFVSDNSLSFFAGRQLFTALDNFLAGMAAAHFLKTKTWRFSKPVTIFLFLAECFLLPIIGRLGFTYGIHTNNISGYLWHSLVAFVLFLMMITFSNISFSVDRLLVKPLIWLSGVEYGVYLWHLVMYNNLVGKSSTIQTLLANGHQKLVYLILMGLAILIGAFMTQLVDKAVSYVR